MAGRGACGDVRPRRLSARPRAGHDPPADEGGDRPHAHRRRRRARAVRRRPRAGRRSDRSARRSVGQASRRARHWTEEGGRPPPSIRVARRGARRGPLRLRGRGSAALPANSNDGRLRASSSPLSSYTPLGGGVLLPQAARSRLRCQPVSLSRVNEWLSARADALAAAAGVPREQLELSPADIQLLLDLAGHAAHDGGARTNAPLLCYLVGLAHGESKTLAELDEIVRSTS